MKGGHSIKRTLFTLTCWLLLAAACFGQSLVGIGTTDPRQTGTITTSSSVVVTPVSNYPGVLVTASGTYTGVTINFEVSDDAGVTWFSQSCTRTDSSTTIETSEAVTNSASRAWTCPLNGATNFRVRSSAYSTGTMNIGITETRSVSAKAGGGGAGGVAAPAASKVIGSTGSALTAQPAAYASALSTGAIAATTLCSTTTCPSGAYLVSVYADEEGGSGCTTVTSGAVKVQLNYVDINGVTRSASLVPTQASPGGIYNALGTSFTTAGTGAGFGTAVVNTNGTAVGGSDSIQILTAVVACATPGPWTGYKVRAWLFPIG